MKLYELMKRPPWFLSVSTWITDDDDPIQAGPNARQAVIIPLLLMQYGSVAAKLKTFTRLGDYLVASIKGMRESSKNIRLNPRTGERSVDADTLHELEAWAKEELGIATIGYTKVNPDFIFAEFEILYDRAIMLTMEMNKEIVATSPSDACNREIFRTYAALGNAVNRIADWLRERGYDCHPSPAIGGDINTVPTAQDANLGRIGKNGILITPEHGPCVRLAAVFVDVDDLPMAGANEHGWVEDFCETCNLCVEKCPGGAVHAEPFLLADGTRAYIEREKCAPAFSDGCSVCISCCPFTGGQYGRIHEAWLRQHEQAEGA